MVVDDHPMWREGVARDLEESGLRVVATAGTGTEALARFPAARPDVVVLDLQIPAPNGVEVTASMVRDNPAVRVLILSASGEQQDVLDAVKAGATGYLVKSASRAELLAALLRVAEGDTVFTPGLAGLRRQASRRCGCILIEIVPVTPAKSLVAAMASFSWGPSVSVSTLNLDQPNTFIAS